MKSSSIGAQGYGYWGGSSWYYYPAKDEIEEEWERLFAMNYDGSQLFGSWDPGSWHQLVIAWQNAANDGKGPPNTIVPGDNSPPGNYSQSDLICYFDGEAKTANPYYYHLAYQNNNAWQYMMVGHEWWQGSGSISHYQRNMLNAVIGSVRIWNSKLSASDVRSEYGSGIYVKNGTYTSPSITPVPGTAVKWGTIDWTQAVPTSNESLTIDVNASGSYTGAWTSPGGGYPINASSQSISYRAALASGSESTTQPNTQLLATPGFECSDVLPACWSSSSPGWGSDVYSTKSTSGISPHEGSKFAIIYWLGGRWQTVNVTAGKSYRFTGWGYVPSGGIGTWGSCITMSWLNSSSNVLGEETQLDLQNLTRNDWNQVDSGWQTAPSNAVKARIIFMTWEEWGGRPPDYTCFDDFSFLEQGSTVTVPVLETPVLEDVSITYMQKAKTLYQQ
jgi:hypothetical protein